MSTHLNYNKSIHRIPNYLWPHITTYRYIMNKIQKSQCSNKIKIHIKHRMLCILCEANPLTIYTYLINHKMLKSTSKCRCEKRVKHKKYVLCSPVLVQITRFLSCKICLN